MYFLLLYRMWRKSQNSSLYTGLHKKKHKYVFLGLPNSGKNTTIKQLFEDGYLDSLPYVDSNSTVTFEDVNFDLNEQNSE